jgi:glycosyltransferase 2 family protein
VNDRDRGEPRPVEEEATPRTKSGPRRWLPLLARLVVFAALLAWFFFYADRQAFAAAFASIPLWAFVPAALLGAAVITLGGLRWRVLMGAFGASDLPSALSTVRLFFVGLFYNTFVPGSFGGDVVRGVVTRHYFDKPAASYVVVVLERLIGFTAMGLVFLLGLVIGPQIIDVREHLPSLAALLALGVIVALVALFSGKLAQYWRRIPPVERPLNLLWVLCISFVSHFTGIAAMYALSRGMGLPISYTDLVLIMPVVFTASVIPLNVFGVGTREVTLVTLLPLLGISPEQALALSLGYAVKALGLAAIGGVIQLVQGRVGVKRAG